MKISDFLKDTKQSKLSFEMCNLEDNLEIKDNKSLLIYPEGMGRVAFVNTEFYKKLMKTIGSSKTKRIKINVKIWSDSDVKR